MKRFAVLPLAALAFAAACSDSPTGVNEPVVPLGGPSFHVVSAGGEHSELFPSITAPSDNPQPGLVTISWRAPESSNAERWSYKITRTGDGSPVINQTSVNAVSATRDYSVSSHSLSAGSYTLWVRGERGDPGVAKGDRALHAPVWATKMFTVETPPPADQAPPIVVCAVPNLDTWYDENVTVTCTASDSDSGLKLDADSTFSLSTAVTQGVETSSASTGSRTITDNAGNSIIAGPYTYKVDLKAPGITFVSRTPAANDDLWNNSDVTVNWTCTDSGSGVVAATVSATVSAEGENQSATGTCTDNAGNVASDTRSGINIDKTAPILNPSVSPNPVLLNGSATASAGASDALSGLASQSCGAVAASSVGSKTVSCTATDKAGNTASGSATYSVGYDFVGFAKPVESNGVLNVGKAGQAIPLKWRLLDANGQPVTSLGSVNVSVQSLTCDAGATTDNVEEYASGSSGLQNLGDGYYQFNWKTPTTYAYSCKTMKLSLGEGTNSTRNALFKFTK
jgi:hypothetical protein